jgi:hypothetical protein
MQRSEVIGLVQTQIDQGGWFNGHGESCRIISNPDATRGSEDSRDDDMPRQHGMVGNRRDGRQEEGDAMGDNGATSIRLIMKIKSGE